MTSTLCPYLKGRLSEFAEKDKGVQKIQNFLGTSQVDGSSDGPGVREGEPQPGGRPHEPQVGAFYPLSVQYMFLKIF